MILDAWKAFTRWFLPDYGLTGEETQSRNRANLQALSLASLIMGPILLAVYMNADGFAYFALGVALFWGLPIVVAMQLGESRDRTGWMWGFWLGWLGVLILACMTNQNAAPKVSEPQISELAMRELAVRELEAKVRLAELRQAGQEQ